MAAKSTTPATPKKSARPAKATIDGPSVPVRDGEKPWTQAQLRALRADIDEEIATLQRDLEQTEGDLEALMKEPGDGAGDDQADAGAKTYDREQEMTVAANARELLAQNLRAIARLEGGGYGSCESCEQPIGKERLMAAPRVTLCLDCKLLEERRG